MASHWGNPSLTEQRPSTSSCVCNPSISRKMSPNPKQKNKKMYFPGFSDATCPSPVLNDHYSQTLSQGLAVPSHLIWGNLMHMHSISGETKKKETSSLPTQHGETASSTNWCKQTASYTATITIFQQTSNFRYWVRFTPSEVTTPTWRGSDNTATVETVRRTIFDFTHHRLSVVLYSQLDFIQKSHEILLKVDRVRPTWVRWYWALGTTISVEWKEPGHREHNTLLSVN